LPFLENCFKHGASKQIGQCWINMDLSVEGNTLYLKLVNGSSNDDGEQQLNEGIGLINVQKRMNLLYPNAHKLKTYCCEDVFTVSLQLELNSLKQLDQKV